MAQNDVLKRYLDAGLEIGLLTQARAEALVKDLVKRGEVQADQAREVAADLLARSRKNSERLLETVRKEVRAQVTERGLVSKADLDKLEARVSKFLSQVVQVTPTTAGAPKKKAAARKTAAKKAPATKAAAKKTTAAKAKKAPPKKKTAAKTAAARKRPASGS